MRRWFRLASLGFVFVLLLSAPGGPRVNAQGGGDIIPPGEVFSTTKGDPPPDTGPFTKNRQDEPWVVLNPNNAQNLAMGFNDWSGEPSCTNATPSNCSPAPGVSLSGFVRSSNKGSSFDALCPPVGGRPQARIDLSALGAFAFGDPSLAFDSQGHLFYGTVGFPNSAPGVNADVFVAKSTDGGCTYPTAVDVSGNVKFDDKDSIAVDINSNSPCRDNVYLAWTELGKGGRGGPDKIVISHSTDGGQTWTKPRQLSPGNPVGRSGAAVKADNGNVWVAWLDQSQLHMAVSTDCGKKFDKHIIVAAVNPVVGPYPGASFRVNSFPALVVGPDGSTLYVAWADRTSGHTVIKVAKSTTKGLTWKDPVVAGNVTAFGSPAAGSSGLPASAFFPALDVDTAGNLNLAFLALEDKPAGTTPGKDVVHFALFVRQSKDGGSTWADPLIGSGIGGNFSNPKGDDPDASSSDDLKTQFLGDYISAVSVPVSMPVSSSLRKFLVAWTSTGNAQTCDAVDAFRAGGAKPNVITQCVLAGSPNFGNTDARLTNTFTYTP